MNSSFVKVRFDLFLDRPQVIARVSKKKRRVLAKTGAYARKVMKTVLSKRAATRVTTGRTTRDDKGRFRSQKKRLGHSRPGEPPRQVTGLLRDRTLFAFDPEASSVVIGPQVDAKINGDNRLIGAASVPNLLDEGGRESLVFPNGKRKVVTYEPRPFLEPTYQGSIKFFEGLIEDEPL